MIIKCKGCGSTCGSPQASAGIFTILPAALLTGIICAFLVRRIEVGHSWQRCRFGCCYLAFCGSFHDGLLFFGMDCVHARSVERVVGIGRSIPALVCETLLYFDWVAMAGLE